MIDRCRQKVDRLAADRGHALRAAAEERTALDSALGKARDLDQARVLVREVAEGVQRNAHERVADLVTRCLEAVFGEDAYEFKIHFKQARGKTEARLLFARDGEEIDPLGAAGGGVVDVASFALRLSCLMMSRPRLRRLLVLDEPFKHLSKQYRPAIRGLLMDLAKELGVQFILVTHDPALQIGTVVEIE